MNEATTSFLETHWLHVLQSLDDGVVVLDRDHRIVFMNEGAAGLTSLSALRAVGQPADRVFRRNPWLAELLANTRTTRARNVRADLSLQGEGRKGLPVRGAATVLVNAEGTEVGTLLTLHDLSYQRALESRSRETERLRQLEILLAGLAHEIKNPLSGMRGAAQILATAPHADARARECTQIILTEIDRLNALMAQLLDLTGPPRLERRRVNVHELIDRVLAIESAGAPPRLRIVRSFDPSLPPVLGDAGRLTQVLLNLVRNAIEASPSEGVVTVATRMETSYYVGRATGRAQFLSIDVCDQGSGVAPENSERIFSPFFTTKNGGTGLGLAISQRIVTEHGGALRVSSDAERGAVFTVTLPVESRTAHE